LNKINYTNQKFNLHIKDSERTRTLNNLAFIELKGAGKYKIENLFKVETWLPSALKRLNETTSQCTRFYSRYAVLTILPTGGNGKSKKQSGTTGNTDLALKTLRLSQNQHSQAV
jgi:hypothetical protein